MKIESISRERERERRLTYRRIGRLRVSSGRKLLAIVEACERQIQ